MPEGEGFVGCIKNLTFSASGKNVIYDLGSPADGENFTPGKKQKTFIEISNLYLSSLVYNCISPTT